MINNSTISGNHADNSGGGIYNSGMLRVTNSTISGNNVGYTVYNYRIGRIGGINNNGGTLTISDSTVSGNWALVSVGGIGNNSNASTIRNSIVANNSPGNCANGSITSNGYNLSSDSTCNFNNTGDLNNIDPMLGPLQNNGGPTQTTALLPGSPAMMRAIRVAAPTVRAIC